MAGSGGGGGGSAGGNGSGSGGSDGGPAFSLPWLLNCWCRRKVAGGGGGAGYQEPNSPNSPSASWNNVPAVEGGAGRGGFGLTCY